MFSNLERINIKISQYRRILNRLSMNLEQIKFTRRLDYLLTNLGKLFDEISNFIPKPKITIIESDDRINIKVNQSSQSINQIADGDNDNEDDEEVSKDVDDNDVKLNANEKIISYGKLEQFKYIPLSNPIESSNDSICILCQQYASQQLGPLLRMNTYKQIPKFLFMHEQCALWTTGLYFFQDEKTGVNQSKDPRNILDIILMANMNKCLLCKKEGASLECDKCTNKFHFPCFMNQYNYGTFDYQNFQITCNNHSKKQAKIQKKIREKQKLHFDQLRKLTMIKEKLLNSHNMNEEISNQNNELQIANLNEEVDQNNFRSLLNSRPNGSRINDISMYENGHKQEVIYSNKNEFVNGFQPQQQFVFKVVNQNHDIFQ